MGNQSKSSHIHRLTSSSSNHWMHLLYVIDLASLHCIQQHTCMTHAMSHWWFVRSLLESSVMCNIIINISQLTHLCVCDRKFTRHILQSKCKWWTFIQYPHVCTDEHDRNITGLKVFKRKRKYFLLLTGCINWLNNIWTNKQTNFS